MSIEAGRDLGWYRFIGIDGMAISVDSFGSSAPAADLAIEFGFSPEDIMQRLIYS